MKKFKLFIFTLLICMVLPKNIMALEKDFCSVFDKGNEVVDVNAVNDYENVLIQRVNDLNENNGKGYLVTYRYSYDMNINKVTDEEKTNIENIKVEDNFNSYDDALAYYNNIVVQLPFVKGGYKISTLDIPVVTTEESGSIECNSLDCSNEIEQLNKKLSDNQQLNYSIVPVQVEGTEKEYVVYKVNDEVVLFNTMEEANEFANTYVPTLNGYSFVVNTINPISVTNKVNKTYKDLIGNNVFDTYDEAVSKLNEFNANYDVTSKKIISIRDESKDIIDSDVLTFNTMEEVNEWISENKLSSDEGILETEITSEKEKYDESTISGEFSSQALAENYLEQLKNDGYVVSNGKITQVSDGITGQVLSGKSFPSASEYVFATDNTNFILIKQGSGHFAVWTEKPLTDDEKNLFVESYNTVNSGNNKFDGSTTNINISEITWIDGYKSFDLSDLGNNWGVYEFTSDGENIILSCDSSKVSHVIRGFAQEDIKYVVSGTKYKERDVYKVKYNKVIYGYKYEIDATALVDEITTKYQISSEFVKMENASKLNYSIDTSYINTVYKLEYTKYVPVIKEMASIDWVIIRCEYPYGNGDVNNYDGNGNGNNSDYPNPPQTGFDMNLSMIIYVLFGGILLISYKACKLIRNN